MKCKEIKCDILGEKRLTTKDGIKVRMLIVDNLDLPKDIVDNGKKNAVNVNFIKIGNTFSILH